MQHFQHLHSIYLFLCPPLILINPHYSLNANRQLKQAISYYLVGIITSSLHIFGLENYSSCSCLSSTFTLEYTNLSRMLLLSNFS